ncbi:MAG: hypothetical protein H0Z33_15420 [Bacillaceae bacterium]|nr:hypothetical protein [Bacillaceae bacterium]
MNKQDRLNQLEDNLGDLAVEFILKLRCHFTIDKTLLNDIFNILNEVEELIYGEKYISRALVSHIFSLILDLEGHCEHVEEEECNAVSRLTEQLDRILSDTLQDWKREGSF